jgi:hypothetical protein
VKNRRCVVCAVAIAAVLICVVPALAAPSFYGYTGLVRVPTAEALDEDEYNLAAFSLNFEEGSDSSVYTGNLGLTEGLELGFTRFRPDEGENETFVNGKYLFRAETREQPAIAAGVIDFTDENDTTVYVVLTKDLSGRYGHRMRPLDAAHVHIGVGGGQFDGVFGAISAVISRRLLLSIEHDSNEVNFGARLALSDELRAHFGALDGFDDIGLGLSFNKSF